MNQRLSNGLTLRSATPEDIDALVDFHQRIQGEGEWTNILAAGDHPTTSWREFTLVTDSGGKIVSSMCMIPQTWLYDGIPFGFTRMEMVSTDEAYRRQGLVRAQFEWLQSTCVERGYPVQGVVGRPFVYKRLGYAMALRYGAGIEVSRHGLPRLAEGQDEPFLLRPGAPDDLPFFTGLVQRGWERYEIAAVREEAHWRHEFFERKRAGDMRLRLGILTGPGGGPVGGLVHTPSAGDGMMGVYTLELLPEISWYATLPSILRGLEAIGEAYAAVEKTRFDGFEFWLGTEHPIHPLLGDYMRRSVPESPLAWYLRVPDLPGFLRLIAPALEKRLACSVLAGFSGDLNVDFYTRNAGLTMHFEQGRLAAVESKEGKWGQGAMPVESFLQILFGYRSVEEIEAASAEVHLRNPLRLALQICFPKRPSFVLSIC